MDHQGHGMDLNHAIFQKPHRVTFDYLEQDRPKHYDGATSPLWPKGVPDKYKLAQFEHKKPSTPNPTVVSHEGFFTDVPGFESLAEGNSAKMLGSLSLARQGRYFYWGYSTDPQDLTAGGQDTLINVLHYMFGRRGEQTTPFVSKTRKILWVYTVLGKQTGYKRGVEEHFPNQLVEQWRESYTPTFEGADAWVKENLPYVFSGKSEKHADKRYKTRFEVDADAKAMGTPNNQRASLEKWLALADQEGADAEDRARAKRCLKRYVHTPIYPDGGTWAAWYAKHRENLVFVDSAGFWWMLDPTKTQ
ncbi:MAG: hypothetical protein ACJA0V_002019 [Planctomycetota bacterium]|jgi:hypothetical protein